MFFDGIYLKFFIIVPNKIYNGEKNYHPSTVNNTKLLEKNQLGGILPPPPPSVKNNRGKVMFYYFLN